MDASALGLAAAAAALGFSAVGSALGTGYAGMAAVGAWKKCFAQDKPAPFILRLRFRLVHGFYVLDHLFKDRAMSMNDCGHRIHPFLYLRVNGPGLQAQRGFLNSAKMFLIFCEQGLVVAVYKLFFDQHHPDNPC